MAEYYVDPLNGDDGTGDGSSGSPWASIDQAFTDISSAGTNGDRINIINSAELVLSAALNIPDIWTQRAPLTIEGCTATAGDGGVATCDCDGDGFITFSTGGRFVLKNLDIYNAAAKPVIRPRFSPTLVVGCTIRDSSAYAIEGLSQIDLVGCTIDNCGRVNNARLYGCLLKSGANSDILVVGGCVLSSRFLLTANAIAVQAKNTMVIANNSIASTAGTGKGIDLQVAGAGGVIVNNIVSGFSSGENFDFHLADAVLVANNSSYNDGGSGFTGHYGMEVFGNEALGSEPFVDAANDDFTPNDIGSLSSGYPSGLNAWRGAVQPVSGGGGGGFYNPFKQPVMGGV